MRRAWPMVCLMILAAACSPPVAQKFEEGCADGPECVPSTTSVVTRPPPPVGPAPWTIDNPPLGRSPAGQNIVVVSGIDAGLDGEEGVRWGDEEGEWEYRLTGETLRIWSTHRLSFIERVTVSIEIDLSTDPPTVTDGAVTSMTSDDAPVTEFMSAGVLVLQSADPSGEVAGRFQGFTEDVVFWIDLGSDR